MSGQVGLVVHPRRDLDSALAATRAWASRRGVAIGQIRIPGQARTIAEPVDAASCDFVIALGGDGTALAALHAAAPAARPVLAIACGSIGALTSVDSQHLDSALELVVAGDWVPQALPGLDIHAGATNLAVAINDVAVVRDGTGQVITEIRVDGEVYARTAGDGVVVATPLGSSAYTMAAGGPILLPGANAMVLTPLARHGGVSPPLVVGAESRIGLLVEPGYGGSRFEVDGQEVVVEALETTVTLRRDYATLIRLADQEPILAALRRRGLVVDSPRILARALRAAPPLGERSRRPERQQCVGRVPDELVCGARTKQSKDAGPKACWARRGPRTPECAGYRVVRRARQTSSRKTISVESDFRGPNFRMRV